MFSQNLELPVKEISRALSALTSWKFLRWNRVRCIHTIVKDYKRIPSIFSYVNFPPFSSTFFSNSICMDTAGRESIDPRFWRASVTTSPSSELDLSLSRLIAKAQNSDPIHLPLTGFTPQMQIWYARDVEEATYTLAFFKILLIVMVSRISNKPDVGFTMPKIGEVYSIDSMDPICSNLFFSKRISKESSLITLLSNRISRYFWKFAILSATQEDLNDL